MKNEDWRSNCNFPPTTPVLPFFSRHVSPDMSSARMQAFFFFRFAKAPFDSRPLRNLEASPPFLSAQSKKRLGRIGPFRPHIAHIFPVFFFFPKSFSWPQSQLGAESSDTLWAPGREPPGSSSPLRYRPHDTKEAFSFSLCGRWLTHCPPRYRRRRPEARYPELPFPTNCFSW